MGALVVVSLSLLAFVLPGPVGARLSAEPEPSPPTATRFATGTGYLHSASTATALSSRQSAGPDTFDVYGGPLRRLRDPDGIPGSGDEYVEGKFEDEVGFVPRGLSPDPGDWTGVDLTDQPSRWHVDTFNAENLGGGVGNRAMWAGLPVGDPETVGWSAAPGYGNDWTSILQYESDVVTDPLVGRIVDLDFAFNLDTEPGHDFLTVEYERAGTWVEVFSISGSSKEGGIFPSPGMLYSQQPDRLPIEYSGGDYGAGGRVRIRIVFRSDGAFSDEDGGVDTDGAAQIDDMSVGSDTGLLTEDFEGPGPYLFQPTRAPFAGDFAQIFAYLTDIDPCAENISPQLAFVDNGQAPPNGPGTSGLASTGGSSSPTWGYGPPGGFVVNHTGGLDGVPLHNVAESPVIDWDLPGAEDDAPDIRGKTLSFTVWKHEPFANGIFYTWAVRGLVDGAWSPWDGYRTLYFSSRAAYVRENYDLNTVLPVHPEKVQIRLGVIDLAAVYGVPGDDATPAPYFDDVRLSKYRVGGVALSVRDVDLANDAFPVSGTIAVSTSTARDLLDVRFDMARDVNPGVVNVPGDSVVVQARAVLPGTEIEGLSMRWAVRRNPLFEDAIRGLPDRPGVDVDVSVGADAHGNRIATGEVRMSESVTSTGVVVDGTYSADLPDTDFLYPGDVLHYYFEAVDDGGRVTTLPADVSQFGVWDEEGRSDFARTFTVRALPSIRDAAGTQPRMLVWNDFGRGEGEAFFLGAFTELDLVEGFDYDTYTTTGASSGASNGLGSAADTTPLGDRRGHGARVEQILGYTTVLYLSGDLDTNLLSDGSNEAPNDKSADLQLLQSWKSAPGARTTVYFGDHVASATVRDSPLIGGSYVTAVMGVEVVGRDVRATIDYQTAPLVRPTGSVNGFDTEFIAYGGCFGINQFDELGAGPAALASHGFVDFAIGQVYPDIAAGLVFDRASAGYRKLDVTFPYGLQYVFEPAGGSPGTRSARAQLLEEVRELAGGSATSAPPVRRASLSVAPTPFNPRTTVRFTVPVAGTQARVRVYDVRGQLVRTLHDGPAVAEELVLDWDGRDDRGAGVSSGVYLVEATTAGFGDTRKVVLVR